VPDAAKRADEKVAVAAPPRVSPPAPGAVPTPVPAAPAPTQGVAPATEAAQAGDPSLASASAAARTLMRGAAADASSAPDIVSPDLSVRWRLRATVIERSIDGGATWTPQPTGSTARWTSGSAPSPAICWIVGSGGTVLRTIDGQNWQTIMFPNRADLVRVDASSAAAATVTTADAHRFVTDDGGETWREVPLQGF
jgi:photosystem II stability/assembly factor-like uncharacterized protein